MARETRTGARGALERQSKEREGLAARIRRAFPRAHEREVDDAVQHAFVEALEHFERYEAALDKGEEEAIRWLVVVAWRHLRGERRRWHRSRSVPLGTRTPPAMDAPLDMRLDARRQLGRALGLVQVAAELHGGQQAEGLRAALELRMLGDESDASAARRCGVPREYVNRARRWILERLVA